MFHLEFFIGNKMFLPSLVKLHISNALSFYIKYIYLHMFVIIFLIRWRNLVCFNIQYQLNRQMLIIKSCYICKTITYHFAATISASRALIRLEFYIYFLFFAYRNVKSQTSCAFLIKLYIYKCLIATKWCLFSLHQFTLIMR